MRDTIAHSTAKSQPMRSLILVTALALASGALADTATKSAKIDRLLKGQELVSMIADQVQGSRNEGRDIADGFVSQVVKGFDLPPDYARRLDELRQRYLASLEPQWKSGEVVEVFAKAFSEKVSEADVDAALVYYESESGRREVAAFKSAAAEMNAFLAQRIKVQMF